MSIDAVKNFVYAKTKFGYNESATSIELESGFGSKFPDPIIDGAYNLVWWNESDYRDPSRIKEPLMSEDVEIVRCIAKVDDILTIERAQEGTLAGIKNKPGKDYSVCLSLTDKTITDLINAAEKDTTPDEIKKQIVNQQAIFDQTNDAVYTEQIFYDLFENTNDLSIGKIDNIKKSLSQDLVIGSNLIQVEDTNGLEVGQEITIQDCNNLERKLISNLTSSVISISTPISKNFSKGSVLYRSLPTSNLSKLKFSGYEENKLIDNSSPVLIENFEIGAGWQSLKRNSKGDLFLSYTYGANFYIKKSVDQGTTWDEYFKYTHTSSIWGGMYDFDNDDKLHAVLDFDGNINYCYQSDSGFTDWEIIHQDNSYSHSRPFIVVRNDNSKVVFMEGKDVNSPSRNQIKYTIDSGSGFSSWQNVGGDSNYRQFINDYCVSDEGEIYLAIQFLDSSNNFNSYRLNKLTNQSWSGWTVIPKSGSDNQVSVTLACDTTNKLHLVWDEHPGNVVSNDAVIKYCTYDGNSFSSIVKISQSKAMDQKRPVIATDSNNRIHIVWYEQYSGPGNAIIYCSSNDGTNFTYKQISPEGEDGVCFPMILRRMVVSDDPLCIWTNRTLGKSYFYGKWVENVLVNLLQEDLRIQIKSNKSFNKLLSWIEKSKKTGFKVEVSLSLHNDGGDENFVSLNSTTKKINDSDEEVFFECASENQKQNVTLKITMMRQNSTDEVWISKLLGIVE